MSIFPKVDVEKEFSAVVRLCGGLVLSDVLEGSPPFNNADYLFPKQKVIAELKCLTEDHLRSPQTEKRLSEVWQRWKLAGRVSEDSYHDAYWSQMPKDLQAEIYKVASRPIVKRIQKANKQIRGTKEHLKLEDHRGLLLIVNDRNSSFSPAATIHAVQLALQNDFRQIREFVFFTVNQFTRSREVPFPSLHWFHMYMDEKHLEVEDLVNLLGEEWRRHHSKLLGVDGYASEIQDMEGFWHTRFERPNSPK